MSNVRYRNISEKQWKIGKGLNVHFQRGIAKTINASFFLYPLGDRINLGGGLVLFSQLKSIISIQIKMQNINTFGNERRIS